MKNNATKVASFPVATNSMLYRPSHCAGTIIIMEDHVLGVDTLWSKNKMIIDAHSGTDTLHFLPSLGCFGSLVSHTILSKIMSCCSRSGKSL